MSQKTCIVDSLTLSSTQSALNRVRPKFETPGCTLAIITEDRYADVLEIMKNYFLPDEPLCNAFGVEWDTVFEEEVVGMLSQNLSVMMLSDDGANDDGGGRSRVMGIRISYAMLATESDLGSKVDLEPVKDAMAFVEKHTKHVDFFGRYGVDEAMIFVLMATHEDFRKRGVAKKMFLASAALGAELGFKALKVEASSSYTQMICDKEGFEVLCELPYDQYSYKGEVLRKKTGPHTSFKLYGKAL